MLSVLRRTRSGPPCKFVLLTAWLLTLTPLGFATVARAQPFYSQEEKLKADLLKNYNRKVRPVANASHPVDVGLGIGLTQVLDVSLEKGVITTAVWLRASWYDERLDFKAADYGGLSQTVLGIDEIWYPDFLAYNHVELFEKEIRHEETQLYVYSDGWGVFWSRPAVIRTACPIHVWNWPFDTQNCDIQMAAWTYSGFFQEFHAMNYTTFGAAGDAQRVTDGRMDMSIFKGSVEYEVSTAAASKSEQFYACCPNEPWPTITFNFSLKRKPDFYIGSVITPIIVTTYTAFLTFFMPPETGERIGLGVTCMLVVVAMMFVSSDYVPVTEESTTFAMFQMGEFIFALASLVLTVGVLVLYHQVNDSDGDGVRGTRFMHDYLWLTPRQSLSLCRAIDFTAAVMFPTLHTTFIAVILTPNLAWGARIGLGFAAFFGTLAFVVFLSLLIFVLRNFSPKARKQRAAEAAAGPRGKQPPRYSGKFFGQGILHSMQGVTNRRAYQSSGESDTPPQDVQNVGSDAVTTLPPLASPGFGQPIASWFSRDSDPSIIDVELNPVESSRAL